MKKSIIFLVLCSIASAFAQNNDSLLAITKNPSKADTVKIKALNSLGINFYNANKLTEARKFAKLALSKSELLSYKRGIAISNSILGTILSESNDNQNALKCCYKSMEVYRELNDTTCLNYIINLLNIGGVYKQIGLYNKSLDAQIRMLNISEKLKNNDFISTCYNNLANLYRTKGDYSKAISYYDKYYKICYNVDTLSNYPTLFFGLGDIYSKSDLNKSLSYYNRLLNIGKLSNNSSFICSANVGIAKIYKSKKQYDTAITYLNNSLFYNNDEIKSEVYFVLGEVYYGKEKYKLARVNFNKSLEISKRIELKDRIMLNYKNIYKLDSVSGNYLGAMENNKIYVSYKDSLFNIENEKKLLATEMNFSFDKEKSVLKAKQDEVNKVSELNSERQRDIIIGVILLLVLIVFILVFVYKSYLGKNKANKIITLQKHLVEEKQKEILDNITYAKRIQEGILTPTNKMKELLPNSFVYYNPKNIVSGDFYFMDEIDGGTIFATADGTGHGSSGAFMSIIGLNILNEAKKIGIKTPSLVLDYLNKGIAKTFHQETTERVIKDSMDISICKINKEQTQLEYSGAYNPLWIVRNGEIIETKADKKQIGMSDDSIYTNHIIELQKGDMIYIFTDGMADQFSQATNKKLKYKPFGEFLKSISNQPTEEQKDSISIFFDSWKGNAEQTDDVLVMGVRINP